MHRSLATVDVEFDFFSPNISGTLRLIFVPCSRRQNNFDWRDKSDVHVRYFICKFVRSLFLIVKGRQPWEGAQVGNSEKGAQVYSRRKGVQVGNPGK